MIWHVLEFIKNRWTRLGFPGPVPRRLAFVKCGAVVFLVFREADSKPVLCVKVARLPDQADLIRGEYERLSRVYSLLGEESPLAASVPKPLTLERFSDDWVLLESAVPGSAMPPPRGKSPGGLTKESLQLTLLALNWLREFQAATFRGGTQLVGDLAAQADRVVCRLAHETGLESAEERWLGESLRDLQRRSGEQVAAYMQHGDFWFKNIRCGDRRIGVVDWSFCGDPPFPFYDLFMLLIMDALNVEASFEDAPGMGWLGQYFLAGGHLNDAIKEAVRAYSHALGLDPSLAHSFFPIHLAYLARRSALYAHYDLNPTAAPMFRSSLQWLAGRASTFALI